MLRERNLKPLNAVFDINLFEVQATTIFNINIYFHMEWLTLTKLDDTDGLLEIVHFNRWCAYSPLYFIKNRSKTWNVAH